MFLHRPHRYLNHPSLLLLESVLESVRLTTMILNLEKALRHQQRETRAGVLLHRDHTQPLAVMTMKVPLLARRFAPLQCRVLT